MATALPLIEFSFRPQLALTFEEKFNELLRELLGLSEIFFLSQKFALKWIRIEAGISGKQNKNYPESTMVN